MRTVWTTTRHGSRPVRPPAVAPGSPGDGRRASGPACVEPLEGRTLMTNVIANGGFEQPAIPAGATFLMLDPGSTALPGWTITEGNADVVNSWQPAEGAQSLDLNGIAPAVIRQSFPTTPGARYRLSFQYGNNPGGSDRSPSAFVQVVASDQATLDFAEQITHAGSTNADMRYTSFAADFTASSAATTLRFQSLSTGAGGIALDAVSVEPDADIPVEADLSVNVRGLSAVAPGGLLTYRVAVANRGPRAAPTVVLTNALPDRATFDSLTSPAGWAVTTPAVGATGAVSFTAAALPAGASAFFTVTVLVADDATGGATLAYTAAVRSSLADPAPAGNAATHTTTVDAALTAADLAVTLSTSAPAVVGRNLTYTVTVYNDGPVSTGAVMTASLPAGATFVSTTAGQAAGPPGDTTVTADLGTLAVGGLAAVSIVVKPTVWGPQGVSVTVSGTVPDPVPANNTVRAVAIAGQAASRFEIARHQAEERRAYLRFAQSLRAEVRGLGGREGVIARMQVSRTLRAVLLDLRRHWSIETRSGVIYPFEFPAR